MLYVSFDAVEAKPRISGFFGLPGRGGSVRFYLMQFVGRTCVFVCAQSCPTLCDPMDSGPPGSSVHGILQARILEWVAMPSLRGSSRPRNRTCVSWIGRRILYQLRPPGKLVSLELHVGKGKFILAHSIELYQSKIPKAVLGANNTHSHTYLNSFLMGFSPVRASLVAQLVKNLLAMWETWVWSLGWEDPLEKGQATHSSILAWRIPWTVYSMGLQKVGYDSFSCKEWSQKHSPV